MDGEGADPWVWILAQRIQHLCGRLEAAVGLRIEQADDLAAKLVVAE